MSVGPRFDAGGRVEMSRSLLRIANYANALMTNTAARDIGE